MEIGVQTGYQIKLAIELAVLLVSSFAARSCGSFAGVAQLVEQLICNHQVGGSNPFTGSNIYKTFDQHVSIAGIVAHTFTHTWAIILRA